MPPLSYAAMLCRVVWAVGGQRLERVMRVVEKNLQLAALYGVRPPLTVDEPLHGDRRLVGVVVAADPTELGYVEAAHAPRLRQGTGGTGVVRQLRGPTVVVGRRDLPERCRFGVLALLVGGRDGIGRLRDERGAAEEVRGHADEVGGHVVSGVRAV